MSFISFLKKAGMILADVASVYAIGEPIFKNIAGTNAAAVNAIDKLGLIINSVVATEGQFAAAFPGQQTGPQKLLAASSLVGPILSTVDVIRGKSIANEAAYAAAIQTITKGVADLLNSLHGDSGQPAASAAVLAPAQATAPTVTPPAA
jgi:hypothetical protein